MPLSRIGQGSLAAPRDGSRYQSGENRRLVGRKDACPDPTLPLRLTPACPGLKNKGMEFATSVNVGFTPSYNWLLNVVWDNDHGNVFMLFYTFCTYKVKGRNLQNLVTALRLETAVALH